MRTRAFVLAGVAALVAAKAFAQARPTFEIAPFIGYRFGDGAMPLGDGAST